MSSNKFQDIVDKIDDVLAGSADPTVLNYTIAGRTLQRISPTELIKLRSHYAKLAFDQERLQLDKKPLTKFVYQL